MTLRLLVIGSLIGTVAGIAAGAWGAIRQYRLSDRVVTMLALLVLSTPTFVIASLLIRRAASQLGPGRTGFRLHR